jgi:hypothetical protein
LREAQYWSCNATDGERAHIATSDTWTDGEPERAAAHWRQILATYPHDTLAFRVAHFTDFRLGRPVCMLTADKPGFS